MPDTLTMPAPASTQPAATPTPSQESPASVGSATASPKVLAGAEDAFGHYAGLGTPEPVVEDGEAAQTPQSPGPADAGHPDETQGTAGA
jgi:hypothetical protein